MTPVSPYAVDGSGIVHYAGFGGDASGLTRGFPDVEAGYTVYSLAATAATDSTRGQMLIFDVRTNANLDEANTNVVSVYAEDTAGELQSVPIAAAEVTGGIPDSCVLDSNCQSEMSGATSYFAAALYQEGTTLRIGLYPKDMCVGMKEESDVFPRDCDDSAQELRPTSSSHKTMELTFVIGPESTGGGRADEGTSESKTISLRFYRDAPSFSCPADDVYFPGDGEISVDPAGFHPAEGDGGAPVTELVMIGREGSQPLTGASNYFRNDLFVRVAATSGAKSITGFENTTTGADNAYFIDFTVRDAAGVMREFGCPLGPVQTAAIQGFLSRSSCFVATATYRSPDAGPVELLRAFRDRILLRTVWGDALVEGYYRHSPPAAKWLEEHAWARFPVLTAFGPILLVAWMALHPAALLGAAAVALSGAFAARRRRERSA